MKPTSGSRSRTKVGGTGKSLTFKSKAIGKASAGGIKHRNGDSYINMNVKEAFSQREPERLSTGGAEPYAD